MIHLLMTVVALSPPVAPTQLEYRAPSGCPSDADFRAAVAARGGALSDHPPFERAPLLLVSIQRQATGFGGSFQVRGPGRGTGKRQLTAATCAEVADALALVTAIEVRGEAEAPASPATPEASSPVVAPPSDASPPARPVSTASVPDADGRLRGRTEAFPSRTETVRVDAGDLRFDLSRPVAVGVGATYGLLRSTWLPTYRLQSTTASFVTMPGGIQRIAGPVFGLHVEYLGNGTYTSADTTTVAHGVSFGFDICQAPLYDTRGFTALVCAEFGGGLLKLDTKSLTGATIQTKNAGFGTAAGVIDLRYNLWAGLFVNARVSGGFILGDVTAERADGSRIFEPGRWSASGTLGLGWHF